MSYKKSIITKEKLKELSKTQNIYQKGGERK